jgi:glycosyltransferase involved in cell wall biosynthesis
LNQPLLIGIPQLRPPVSGPLLRIAFFSPELPSIGGSNGIITYCRIMRDALRDLGHSVMIVSASHVEHFDGRIAELPRPSAWNRLRGRRYQDNFARCDKEFSRTAVIPNPMPTATQRWSKGSADLDQVVFVGRFDKAKGADIAVEAFVEARKRRPLLKMVMIGPGKSPADVPSGVTVLGALPAERITELRLQSAVALSCSRSEAFSYVVAEAMALGMPVLATDTFGPSEIIRDRIDGRLSPAGDAEGTAEALVEMLADPSKLAEMGKAAALRVSDYMSPRRIASQTAELYADLCFSPAERMADV